MLGLAVLYFFTSHMLIFKCLSFSFPIPAIFGFQMDSTLTNPHAACIESIPSATDDLPAGYQEDLNLRPPRLGARDTTVDTYND